MMPKQNHRKTLKELYDEFQILRTEFYQIRDGSYEDTHNHKRIPTVGELKDQIATLDARLIRLESETL